MHVTKKANFASLRSLWSVNKQARVMNVEDVYEIQYRFE